VTDAEPCGSPAGETDPETAGPPEWDTAWGIAAGLTVVFGYFLLHDIAALVAATFVADETRVLWASLVANMLVVGFFVMLARRGSGRGSARSVLGLVAPARIPAARILGLFVAGFIAYMAVSVAMAQLWSFLEPEEAEFPRQRVISLVASIESPLLLAVAVLLAVVVAPLAEELVFRRALYLPLRRATGVCVAAILVSVAFALAHGYLWGLPQLAVLSVVFVALYESTGTLWASIFGHAAHNALMLALLFQVTEVH
jgi:membrane protease YdiL (CAAX protease family)